MPLLASPLKGKGRCWRTPACSSRRGLPGWLGSADIAEEAVDLTAQCLRLARQLFHRAEDLGRGGASVVRRLGDDADVRRDLSRTGRSLLQ